MTGWRSELFEEFQQTPSIVELVGFFIPRRSKPGRVLINRKQLLKIIPLCERTILDMERRGSLPVGGRRYHAAENRAAREALPPLADIIEMGSDSSCEFVYLTM